MKRATPVILLACAWGLGLCAGRVFDSFILWIGLSLAAVLIACVPRTRVPALVIAVFCLGAARLTLPAPANHLSRLLKAPLTGTVQGEIRSIGDSLTHSYRYRLRLWAVNDIPVRGSVFLSVSRNDLRPGDLVRLSGTLTPLPAETNPDSPDWDEYFRGRGISGFIRSNPGVEITGHTSRPYLRVIGSVRRFLFKRLGRFGANAGFTRQLVLGTPIPWDERADNLKHAGLTHLIAVSGLHAAILALVLNGLLTVVFRRKIPVRILLILLLFTYAAVCDWAPAVSRAAIMIGLYEVSRIMQRNVSMTHLLGLAFLIITAVSPLQVFQPGFQLSFLCMLVLLEVTPKQIDLFWLGLSRKWTRRLEPVTRGIIDAAVISLAIAPITLLHFHQATLNGIVGNILGIPLFGLILPLALLVTVLPGWACAPYISAFGGVLRVFDTWVSSCARLPLRIDFVPFSTIQAALFTIGLIAGGIALTRRQWKWATCAGLFISMLFLPFHRSPSSLRVTFFEVGAADAVLIQTDSVRVLLDTGTGRSFHSTVLPYLQAKGIDTFDAVILSHAHEDHAGGLSELLRNTQVTRLVVSPGAARDILRDVQVACPVETLGAPLQFGSLRFRFLLPEETGMGNEASLVAEMKYRGCRFLFTGDLETEEEKEMLDILGPTDILKVAHHGSRYATSCEFLERVSPQAAIVSAPNDGRFPSPETMARLGSLFDRVFVTGTDGAVIVETDGKITRIRSHHSGRSLILHTGDTP
jgi:competence protein ComEC